MADWWGRRYIPVAERKERAADLILSLEAEGRTLSPVKLPGKTIASSFWGKLWCDTLERYRDYETRLPRGKSYVRQGAVVDLRIEPCQISAMVMGTEVYDVDIAVETLDDGRWQALVDACAGHIGSVVELLAGRFSAAVMGHVVDEEHGLIPSSTEIHLKCSCPDHAYMCKHLAAVLYGVGARLDHQPELLFVLRDRDASELAAKATSSGTDALDTGEGVRHRRRLDASLADLFGVELDLAGTPETTRRERAPTPVEVAELDEEQRLLEAVLCLVCARPSTTSQLYSALGAFGELEAVRAAIAALSEAELIGAGSDGRLDTLFDNDDR
jgi:uncharacterized Zn finger protein